MALDPSAASINGDAARIQQIVWNLLTNAVKFTPRGGRVELRLERAESNVRIVVADTGAGITPEALPHVFERFRQADSSSTRAHGGLGLGLALVRHLAELHGGSVGAESAGTGRGATITVQLPVALARIEAADPAQPSPPTAGRTSSPRARLDGLRVLVVDDDTEGLALADAILSRAGAEVRVCSSAVAAFDALKQWRPDVLVSDIEMPGEDGYSLIGRVRALGRHDGGTTPAIALTAYGQPRDRERSLAAGFNVHVVKPVDPDALTALVARVSLERDRPAVS